MFVTYFIKSKKHNKPSYFKRYGNFLRSPIICFLFEVIFFFIFLILFSFMLLCQFKFNKQDRNKVTDLFGNSSLPSYIIMTGQNYSSFGFHLSKKHFDRSINMPYFVEWFLLFWMICYFIEEIKQVNIYILLKTINLYNFVILNYMA